MLFDPEHELRLGFATVEFEAPADQVVDSDYGRWNDFLAASMAGRPSDWEPGAPTAGDGPVQVCLPCLRAEWVRDIRALPTAGWGELDLTAAA